MRQDPAKFESDFGLMWGMDRMRLPCGGTAYFDEDSGISYRCMDCGAVVGSIGMPQVCRDQCEQWEMQQALGGAGWDYYADTEE